MTILLFIFMVIKIRFSAHATIFLRLFYLKAKFQTDHCGCSTTSCCFRFLSARNLGYLTQHAPELYSFFPQIVSCFLLSIHMLARDYQCKEYDMQK